MERRRFLTVLAAAAPLAVAGVVSALGGRDVPIGNPPGPAPRPAPTPPRRAEPADPAPDETPAPEAPGADPLHVLCRDAIGLAPSLAGGVAHTPMRVTIHHSAVLLEEARDAPRQLRAFQRDHQRRGWVDLAYHRAIDPAGNVYELRDPAIEGDSSTDYALTGHLQLLCLGDYDRQEPTPGLLEALARLVAAECAARGMALATLSAHRDHVLTWCPGGTLYARLDDVRTRAGELLAADAPKLVRHCGDEAAARIAAIEAGA